jgi:hypothetical protein
MHPPAFRLAHQLSDWLDCSLELHCCQGTTILPLRLLAMKRGDKTFAEILPRLRCKRCNRPPAPVYLCAGHREHNHGAPADWAIELVPVPRGSNHEGGPVATVPEQTPAPAGDKLAGAATTTAGKASAT